MQFDKTRQLAIVLVSLALAQISFAAEKELPDFELKTTEGESWSLADHAGQPKLIMFWATWCPYCKRLFPSIQSLHETYADAGLKVAAISVYDNGDPRAYRHEHGLTMDVLVDGDALAELLQIPGTPAVILLNQENKIVYATMNSDPHNDELGATVARLMQSESTK